MSNRKVVAPAGSDLARAVKDVARRPGRKVTLVLHPPLLGCVQTIAEAGGLSLSDACVLIMEKSVNHALAPMQAKALALAQEMGGVVVPPRGEN